MKLFRSLAVLFAVAGFGVAAFAQENPSRFAGVVRAVNFAYGFNNTPALSLDMPAPTAAGVATVSVAYGTVALSDGTIIAPLSINAPVTISNASGVETVTPSAVSCTTPLVYQSCTFTATFTYAHGTGDKVTSGTAGLQEAIIFANGKGGGVVGVDYSYTQIAGTTAMITAATVYPTVQLMDTRSGSIVYWTPIGGTTVMTTPTTLTSSTATDSTTPAGTWAASAYAQGYSCVDLMGQEGPVSATYAHTPAAGSSSVTFVAPTNCVGAIGYKVYSTLASASYPLAYELPLVTQPTVIGKAPVSNGSCTLQTINPSVIACAVANTTYGQSASNATFTAIPVNTYRVAPQTTIISTTAVSVPNPGGKTTYTYAPSMHLGFPGVPSTWPAFPISAAAGTTVPSVLGTITVPTGFANVRGKTWQVCGKYTGVSTATVVTINLQWDANLQNTAGEPVNIGALALTPATAFATTAAGTFCEQFQTTVASASATGGTIQSIGGYINTSGVSAAAAGQGASTDPGAAVGSLNLATDARILVLYTHTTGTDGTAPTLYGLTISAL